MPQPNDSIRCCCCWNDNVQQEDDEEEFVATVDGHRVPRQADADEDRDRFRDSVMDMATSASKRPRLLSSPNLQQEEVDLLLRDVVDQYSAARSAAIYVSNLHPLATEETLRTLFAQFGPIVDAYVPEYHQGCGCGFVEFRSLDDVENAIEGLNMSLLYGRSIRVTRTLQVKKNSLDVGATLFVGNLELDMDEKKLNGYFLEFDVFVRAIKTGTPLGSGFCNFDHFEDLSRGIKGIESINEKYLQSRPIIEFCASMKGTRHDTLTGSSWNNNNDSDMPQPNDSIGGCCCWSDNVQQEDDEEEFVATVDGHRVPRRLAFLFTGEWGRSPRQADVDEDRDRFRDSVMDMATSASKRPRLLSSPNLQQEEVDLLLRDVVDQYSAARSAAIYISNLHPLATEETLRTLFAQFGPIVDAYVPEYHQGCGCGFVEFRSLDDVENAIEGLNMSLLYGRSIRVTRTLQVKKNSLDVGATLFVGNLELDMDEKKLNGYFLEFDVFVRAIKIMRDPKTGTPLGSGFCNFDHFEDLSRGIKGIESINEKYLQSRPIIEFCASMKGTRHDTLTGSSWNNNNDSDMHRPNDSIGGCCCWSDNVQQEDDEEEFGTTVDGHRVPLREWSISPRQADPDEDRDSDMDRATSGSKRPRLLSSPNQQQDVVDHENLTEWMVASGSSNPNTKENQYASSSSNPNKKENQYTNIAAV